MSAVSFLVRQTFENIFSNISKEVNEDVLKLAIGIHYLDNGEVKYELQKKNESKYDTIKEIALENYLSVFDVGINVLAMTIDQSGQKYATELKCDKKEVSIVLIPREEIYSEILRKNKKQLPLMIIKKNLETIREAEIEKEFNI